jgi:hypothetical protein
LEAVFPVSFKWEIFDDCKNGIIIVLAWFNEEGCGIIIPRFCLKNFTNGLNDDEDDEEFLGAFYSSKHGES